MLKFMQFPQSAGHSVPETLWVQILHSAEEDNLSPFDSDSKISCLYQSIEINNSKHVCHQSQVRMPNGSGVELAECSLIIGTGCPVQDLLAWSSIAQSVCQLAFSLLEIRFQRPRFLLNCGKKFECAMIQGRGIKALHIIFWFKPF